jgi:hypothetical protein
VRDIIPENIKFSAKTSLSYYELKQHASSFGRRVFKNFKGNKPNCSGLYGPVQINGDKQQNIRREAGTHFRTRK